MSPPRWAGDSSVLPQIIVRAHRSGDGARAGLQNGLKEVWVDVEAQFARPLQTLTTGGSA